jgi:elongation factor G
MKGYEINIIRHSRHVISPSKSNVPEGARRAILVLCSVAGVQSQSITGDQQMKRYKVP